MFFFFKQKTAYEMQRGLVGSEMCIRDRYRAAVSGYLMKGGDCFEEFKKCKIIMEIGLLHDIIASYVKTTLYGIVDIESDNRICQLPQSSSSVIFSQSVFFYLYWGFGAVSYTHLTLPTILLVQISVVVVSLKKNHDQQR
eukprot:TRINITY_DN70661_c0_g1_i1.p4 TRINITY_DN70661_c0_g1~~TRINITY_DN70661_c0_g1_i1.p4  ORF type:complete len:140 (-),score=28.25 TRINITY_DN70661_c0_g1_i1:39-458(-)